MEPIASIQQGRRKRKQSKRSKRYDADFKLQVVKKFIEESVPVPVIVQECGVSHETVRNWVRAYRQNGAAGLSTSYTGHGRSLPSPVRQKIVEVKEANPHFGIKRFSQVVNRAFFLLALP